MSGPIDAGARPAALTIGRSAFLPLLLLTLALVGWLAFQCVQLVMERQQLQQLVTAQQPQVEAANKLRASLDALALATRGLAQEGNPIARSIVDELQRRGVTIQPNATPAK